MSTHSSIPAKEELSPTPIRDSDSSLHELPINPASLPQESPTFNPGWRFNAAFASLCFISLMAALDATSISVALPVPLSFSSHHLIILTNYQIMARVLKGTAIEAFWSGTSFLLTSTIFQPVLGSFSHIFGRKPLIFFSLTLFLIGAVAAATANNFTVILISRSIQGIGGGGIICLTEMVITDMVPLRQRGNYFSIMSGMWAIGTVAGPLLGGGFSQSVSWRW